MLGDMIDLRKDTEFTIREWNEMTFKIRRRIPEIDERLKSKWNNWELVEKTARLAAHLKEIGGRANKVEYMKNNVYRFDWVRTGNEFGEWVLKTKETLEQMRREYEAAN